MRLKIITQKNKGNDQILLLKPDSQVISNYYCKTFLRCLKLLYPERRNRLYYKGLTYYFIPGGMLLSWLMFRLMI